MHGQKATARNKRRRRRSRTAVEEVMDTVALIEASG